MDLTFNAKASEHDWRRMPLRLRARIAWSVLVGRPFAVPGAMRIDIEGVTLVPAPDPHEKETG